MAIILMVLGHSGCGIPFVRQTIYMFHMPLFFFLSGFCFKKKYLSTPKTYLWKRIKRLWWPYVKYGLLFLWLRNFFFSIHVYDEQYGRIHERITFAEGLNLSKHIVLHMGGVDCILDPFWFIRALFLGTLVAYVARYILKNTYIAAALCLLLAILLNYTQWFIPMLHPQTFAVSFLFLVGYAFSENRTPSFSLWQSILCISITFIGGFFWFMEMGPEFYDSMIFIPYFVTAILTTWSIKSLFEKWNEQPKWLQSLLRFCGDNTISILAFHLLAFKLVSYLIVLCNNLPIGMVAAHHVIDGYAEAGWWVAYLITGSAIPIGIAYVKKIIKEYIALKCSHSKRTND